MKINFNEIILRVINADKNKDILKDCPHRIVNDLAVVYGICKFEDDNFKCTTIDNAVAYLLNLTEEELFEQAYENTRKVMGTTIFGIKIDPSEEEDIMVVVSNKFDYMGACQLLYPDILDEVAKHYDSNLYIIPASVHEILAAPENCLTKDSLTETINMVNYTMMDEDVLSDNLYFYNRKTKELKIA